MDELTPEQLEELGRDLEALLEELERLAASTKESSKPVDLDLPIGRLSRIDARQSQEMARAERRNTELRLQQVRAALKRHADEEYGDCRRCEEPVGYARLKARPESALCVECQEELESQR